MHKLLTFPDPQSHVLSVRAKALVFNDPRSEQILATVERVAPSDAAVLIIGETGTGKELLARHVHDRSGRRGPFVAVNCGAFSETLIESELFGHEAGSFTGATRARAGWFEAAQGGTLFLDEIGDLPLPMQVKLLRVLQERQVVRVGSRQPINIDVRLVTATNVDLSAAVEAGHFRRDLFFRINLATVHLPPLAQRPGDILPLAEHFLASYCHKLGRASVVLSSEAQQALLSHDWPGNIRELENVIHYALIVGKDGVVQREDLRLPSKTQRPVALTTYAATSTAIDVQSVDALFDKLEQLFTALFDEQPDALYSEVERRLVRSAYEHCRTNQVRSARLLGISRNVLRAQLKRFGLLPTGGDETETSEAAIGG